MFWKRRKRLDEEIEFHVAQETADNIARGMRADDARRAAVRAFGNVGSHRERARELDPLYWLDTLWQDTRFAFRLIGRNRWTSVTIVATLTLGVALNVSVFSLLNALMLRPPVRHQPETFLTLHPKFSGQYSLRYSDGGMSQPDYLRLRDSAKSIESLAAYRMMSLTMSVNWQGETEERGLKPAPPPQPALPGFQGTVRGGLMSCNFFDVMRPGMPVAGRYLNADECATPMGAPVAVLSESFWQSRFSKDRSVVGRVVHLNRVPVVVVGIAPDFRPGADVWMPYSMLQSLRPGDDYFSDIRGQWLTVVGRRNPRYSLEQVQQELIILARRADEDLPGRTTSLRVSNGALVNDPDRSVKGGAGRPLMFGAVTLGGTALLLLLACVNVTTLLLSRSAARQREIAVRLSLGAGRFRLLRQLMTESMALSGIAAALSFAIAQQAPEALWNSLRLGTAPFDLTADMRVLLYCIAVAMAAGVLAGVSPALESLRPEVAETLKGSSLAVTGGHKRSRLRSVLVGVQVAISLLLVVQASLFVRAQRKYFAHNPGFETRQTLNLMLASVRSGYEAPPSFYEELELRVNSRPWVMQSSLVSLPVWNGRNITFLKDVDGRPMERPKDPMTGAPARRVVTPAYFAAMGIPLIRGRVFRGDEAQTPVPAVISETMARRYWPGEDAVGHRFSTGAVHEVVGVVRDVQSVRYMEDDGAFYYTPLDTRKSRATAMVVRVAGDAQAAAAGLRDVVRQIDPQMATTVTTLQAMIEEKAETMKPALIHGSIAGGLALLLALTGVYGLVSFSVTQRIPEIGIRVALGASRGDVLRMVLRSGMGPVCGGMAVGLGLALAVGSGMESALFGFDARDPMTMVMAPVVLLGAAVGAIWVPARRAAGVEPVVALRYE